MPDQITALMRLPSLFFSWWLSELAGLLPRGLRFSFTTSQPGFILTFKGDEIVLNKRTGRRGEEELGRMAISGAVDRSSSEAAVAFSSLAERRHRKWPITVRLASHLGLRKLVDLPLAAKDDLSQLLLFELDRLTPFKADDVCFAWHVESADTKTGRMKVMLEMAPKTTVSQVVDLAKARGRDVDRVELDSESDDRKPLDLLPGAHHDKPSGGWLNRLLRLTTFILLIVALALPLQKQRSAVGALEAEVATVRAKAEESLAIREQLAFMSGEAGFLADARNNRPTMTELMAELTRLLPDDSHIVQLRINEDSIDLSGLADKASGLVAILDQSPMLGSPKFKSPVTRHQQSGKERFQISVELTAADPS